MKLCVRINFQGLKYAPCHDPAIRRDQDFVQMQNESRQQFGFIRLELADHDRPLRRLAMHGHRAAKAVNDPVFDHADTQILDPLGFVIATRIPLACRDKFDRNRRHVLADPRPPPKPRPHHTIRLPPVAADSNVLFRQSQVERNSFRMMLLIVMKFITKNVIRVCCFITALPAGTQ